MTESSTQTKTRDADQATPDKGRSYDQSYDQNVGGAGQQPPTFWEPPQAVFDQTFASMTGHDQTHLTQRIADAYFEQAEHSLHMARRIADLQALSMIQTSIVQQCAGLVSQQVTQALLRNPQAIVGALRQAGWTVSPPTR